MKRNLVWLIAIVTLVAATAVGAGEIVEQSRSFPAHGEISVDFISGTVEVVAWDKNQISIYADVEGGLESFEVDFDEDELRIDQDIPDHDGSSRKWRREWNGSIALVLKVPHGVSLDVSGINIDTSVTGVTGPIRLEAVNGNLEVDGDAESVEAESINGRIRVTGKVERVEAESVSGRIRLEGVSGRVTAETVSGDIDVSGGPFRELEMGTVSGTISAAGAPTRGASWDLESHSGDLTVRLPKDASAEIEAETFSGGIDNALGPRSERTDRYAPGEEVSFQLGSGSAQISLSTFSGRLRILPLE